MNQDDSRYKVIDPNAIEEWKKVYNDRNAVIAWHKKYTPWLGDDKVMEQIADYYDTCKKKVNAVVDIIKSKGKRRTDARAFQLLRALKQKYIECENTAAFEDHIKTLLHNKDQRDILVKYDDTKTEEENIDIVYQKILDSRDLTMQYLKEMIDQNRAEFKKFVTEKYPYLKYEDVELVIEIIGFNDKNE